jgi:hypothetical protein
MVNRKIKRSLKPGDTVRPEIFRRTHKKALKIAKDEGLQIWKVYEIAIHNFYLNIKRNPDTGELLTPEKTLADDEEE